MNSFLKRLNTHTIGKAGRASEKRLAKQLGGKVRPASGAVEGLKGDIVFDNVLMEAKSTLKNSISIKHDWLAKIATEARNDGKTPALAVSFVTPEGKPVVSGDWIMVPRHVWEGHLRYETGDE